MLKSKIEINELPDESVDVFRSNILNSYRVHPDSLDELSFMNSLHGTNKPQISARAKTLFVQNIIKIPEKMSIYLYTFIKR